MYDFALPITILDLGAKDGGGPPEPYTRLPIELPGSRVIAVDAADNCEYPEGWEGYRAIIARTAGPRRFYHTTWPAADSLYPPNEALFAAYCGLETLRLASTEQVQTVSLDEFAVAYRPIHCIRADIQGGELEAIQGGYDTLRDVLMVVTEVAYAPLYIGGPMFYDIDAALRSLGFVFYRPIAASPWHERPFVVESAELRKRLAAPCIVAGGKLKWRSPTISTGRLLWGDVIYVREDIRSREDWSRVAVCAHLYQCYTLAALYIERYADRVAAEQYLHHVLYDDEKESE